MPERPENAKQDPGNQWTAELRLQKRQGKTTPTNLLARVDEHQVDICSKHEERGIPEKELADDDMSTQRCEEQPDAVDHRNDQECEEVPDDGEAPDAIALENGHDS